MSKSLAEVLAQASHEAASKPLAPGVQVCDKENRTLAIQKALGFNPVKPTSGERVVVGKVKHGKQTSLTGLII